MKKTVSLLVALLLVYSSVCYAAAVPSADYRAPLGYNEHDHDAVYSFLEYENADGVKNGSKLNPDYDANDPQTWTGFYFEMVNGEYHLIQVECPGFSLEGILDVSGCGELMSLDISSNAVSKLICGGCTKLQSINCSWNRRGDFEVLDVSGCSSLAYLNCSDNRITQLDLSSCIELETLNCGYNPLYSIDLTPCPGLTALDCENIGIDELDLSILPELKTLNCSTNGLKTLNASVCPELERLQCDENPFLVSLDVSGCAKLKEFSSCSTGEGLGSSLTALDVSNCRMLTQLDLIGNYITCLDLSNNTQLVSVGLDSTLISQLLLPEGQTLETLNCTNSRLTSIDLSCSPVLKYLYLDNNLLTDIDLSGCPQLTVFMCKDNPLTDIDFTWNPNVNIDRIHADGEGYVGVEYTALFPMGMAFATPKAGESFLGWFNPEGEEISNKIRFIFTDIDDTEIIARFTSGASIVTPGDVNGDGYVTFGDVADLYNFLLGGMELADPACADMDGDGEVTFADVAALYNFILGAAGK